MKVTVPEISGRKPQTAGFTVYEAGEYIAEIQKVTLEDRLKLKQDLLWKVVLVFLDGPARNGKHVGGMKYVHVICLPSPDHASYNDDWYGRSANDLVCMASAAGVQFKKDVVDDTAFAGKTVKIKLGVYHPRNSDDPDELRNVVNAWMPDPGRQPENGGVIAVTDK